MIPADECAKKMLLDAFTANGLLIERAGAHGTESSAAELLSTGRPGSALPMIIHNANVGGGEGLLARSFRTSGTTRSEDLAHVGADGSLFDGLRAPFGSTVPALVERAGTDLGNAMPPDGAVGRFIGMFVRNHTVWACDHSRI